MLSRVRVENFKAFAGSVSLELRPLTLVFGENSAGKSALLRGMALLADSVSELGGPGLDLTSPATRGAAFNELCSRGSASGEISFGLEWSNDPSPVEQLDISVLEMQQTRRQVINRLAARFRDKPPMELQWALPLSETEGNQHRYLSKGEPHTHTAEVHFRGLVPSLPEGGPQELTTRLEQVRSKLARFRESLTWLGAVRRPPARIQTYKGSPSRIRPDGAGAAELLADDHLRGGELTGSVSSWFENNLSCRIEVHQIADYFSIMVSPVDAPGRSVNLCDTGEGICQVFPVVVLALMARSTNLPKHPTLLVEQPELHLQPGLHGAIAELLANTVRQTPGSCIVAETHSGNFVLRLQLEIARGNLPPGLVRLYHVEQDQQGQPRVSKIDFDSEARPQPAWPPGVFSEHVDLSRALLRLLTAESDGAVQHQRVHAA